MNPQHRLRCPTNPSLPRLRQIVRAAYPLRRMGHLKERGNVEIQN
jgi:hypothetical protein